MGFRSKIFRNKRSKVFPRQRGQKGTILKRCNSQKVAAYKVLGIYHFKNRKIARLFYARLLALVREFNEEDVKYIDTTLEKA